MDVVMKAWFAIFLILAQLAAAVAALPAFASRKSEIFAEAAKLGKEASQNKTKKRKPASKPTPTPTPAPKTSPKPESSHGAPAASPAASGAKAAPAAAPATTAPATTAVPAAIAPATTAPAAAASPTVIPSAPMATPVPAATAAPSKPAAWTPKMEKIKAKITANPKDWDSLVELAQDLINAKDFTAAINLLQPHIDSLPRSGLIALAKAYASTSDFTDELKVLQLTMSKHPKDYVVQTMIGDTYALNPLRKDEALAAYQLAREMNGRYRPAFEGQIKVLERDQQYYEARSVLNDMITLFGEEAKLFNTLCRLYSIDNYFEKAIETCEAAIKKTPGLPDNYVYLSSALQGEEKMDRYFKVLGDASSRFPASEMVQVANASAYLQKKDYSEAYKYFRRATQATPKTSRAYLGLANASFELQKYQEALDAYFQTCKLDKRETKDFRIAIGKLRERRESQWQSKFETGLINCN